MTNSARSRYDGRRYDRGTPRNERTSKRVEAANQALSDVLELFERDDLPEMIAQTTIARQEGDSPSASWSLGNQLLTLRAGTADARGFRQWQEVDRHVTKGSRAFYILGPVTRKVKDTDAETGDEVERVITTGFVGIPVFRYEDTDGAELKRPDYQPAAFPPLYDVAARLDVSVEYAPFVDRFQGYYSPSDRRIMLCSHDVRTFFHELAHAAHDRVKPLRGGQLANQEIVAETVAATLCHLYGFDGYLYHGARYIESYANGSNPTKAAMRVLGDVQAVLALLFEATPAKTKRELVAA